MREAGNDPATLAALAGLSVWTRVQFAATPWSLPSQHGGAASPNGHHDGQRQRRGDGPATVPAAARWPSAAISAAWRTGKPTCSTSLLPSLQGGPKPPAATGHPSAALLPARWRSNRTEAAGLPGWVLVSDRWPGGAVSPYGRMGHGVQRRQRGDGQAAEPAAVRWPAAARSATGQIETPYAQRPFLFLPAWRPGPGRPALRCGTSYRLELCISGVADSQVGAHPGMSHCLCGATRRAAPITTPERLVPARRGDGHDIVPRPLTGSTPVPAQATEPRGSFDACAARGHQALWHNAARPVSVPGVLERGPTLAGHGMDRLWRMGAL
jgi:hypothetical protein